MERNCEKERSGSELGNGEQPADERGVSRPNPVHPVHDQLIGSDPVVARRVRISPLSCSRASPPIHGNQLPRTRAETAARRGLDQQKQTPIAEFRMGLSVRSCRRESANVLTRPRAPVDAARSYGAEQPAQRPTLRQLSIPGPMPVEERVFGCEEIRKICYASRCISICCDRFDGPSAAVRKAPDVVNSDRRRRQLSALASVRQAGELD